MGMNMNGIVPGSSSSTRQSRKPINGSNNAKQSQTINKTSNSKSLFSLPLLFSKNRTSNSQVRQSIHNNNSDNFNHTVELMKSNIPPSSWGSVPIDQEPMEIPPVPLKHGSTVLFDCTMAEVDRFLDSRAKQKK